MSWLHALFTFIALVAGGALASLTLYLYRDNRWIASAAFFISVACWVSAVPVFFAIGFFSN